MADYYPLLARALDALPDRSPALRRAVYDRARNALISQLRSLEPPLSEDDIDLERRALDAAIDRLEIDHGGVPAPANDAALPAADPAPPPPGPAAPEPAPPEPEPTPPEPTPPEPEPAPPFSAPSLPEPAPPEPPAPGADAAGPVGPALPAAAAPVFLPAAPAPDPEPREAAIAIAPRRPRPEPAIPLAAETGDPAAPAEPDAEAEPAAAEAGNGRQRPRIEVVPPRAGRSRLLRNGVVGVALAAVIGAIAVVAFLLRDRPQALPPAGAETAGAQQPDNGDAKFGDRVGGEAAAGAAPRQNGAPAPAPRTDAAQPGIAVAQRAVLLEESASSDSTQPTTTPGRVTWRLDAVNGEQGQPLQTVVAATVTYPEAGLTLVMKIQRNLDATLPASHTVSLAFSQTGPEGTSRVVQDVGLLQAKDDENGRGSPVSGLPVRVRENLFLIGLSSLPSDVERNTDLLLRRPWFEIAVRYASGRRAVLVFEKGTSGTQVLQNAFDAWR